MGFYGEWNFVGGGATCDHAYGMTANTGLVGHNNEILPTPQTVDECSAACCARAWCAPRPHCFPPSPRFWTDAGS